MNLRKPEPVKRDPDKPEYGPISVHCFDTNTRMNLWLTNNPDCLIVDWVGEQGWVWVMYREKK